MLGQFLVEEQDIVEFLEASLPKTLPGDALFDITVKLWESSGSTRFFPRYRTSAIIALN